MRLQERVQSYYDRLVPVRARIYDLVFAADPCAQWPHHLLEAVDAMQTDLLGIVEDAASTGLDPQAQSLVLAFHGPFDETLGHLVGTCGLMEWEELRRQLAAASGNVTGPAVNLDDVADRLQAFLGVARVDLPFLEEFGWRPFFAHFGLALPPTPLEQP